MRPDPTQEIKIPADAIAVAAGLLEATDSPAGCEVWIAVSEMPLAAVLYACSPRGNGRGIEWAAWCVQNSCQTTTPGAVAVGLRIAVRLIDYPAFQDALRRLSLMRPHQHDSVLMMMREAISPWIDQNDTAIGA